MNTYYVVDIGETKETESAAKARAKELSKDSDEVVWVYGFDDSPNALTGFWRHCGYKWGYLYSPDGATITRMFGGM